MNNLDIYQVILNAFATNDKLDAKGLTIDSDLYDQWVRFPITKIVLRKKELDKQPDSQKRSFLIDKLQLTKSYVFAPYITVLKKFSILKADAHNCQQFSAFIPFLIRFFACYSFTIQSSFESHPTFAHTLLKDLTTIQGAMFKFLKFGGQELSVLVDDLYTSLIPFISTSTEVNMFLNDANGVLTAVTNVMMNMQVDHDLAFSGIFDFIIHFTLISIENGVFNSMYETIYNYIISFVSIEMNYTLLTKAQKSHILYIVQRLYMQFRDPTYEGQMMILYGGLNYVATAHKSRELEVLDCVDAILAYLIVIIEKFADDYKPRPDASFSVPEIDMSDIYDLKTTYPKPLLDTNILGTVDYQYIFVQPQQFYTPLFSQILNKFRSTLQTSQDLLKTFISRLTSQSHPLLYSFFISLLNRSKPDTFALFLQTSKFIQYIFDPGILNDMTFDETSNNISVYDYYYQLQEFISTYITIHNSLRHFYEAFAKIIGRRQPKTTSFLIRTLTKALVTSNCNLMTFTYLDFMESVRSTESAFKMYLVKNDNEEIKLARTYLINFYGYIYLKVNPTLIFCQPKSVSHILSLSFEPELFNTVTGWIESGFMTTKATFTLTERCLNILKTVKTPELYLVYINIFNKISETSTNDFCKTLIQTKAFNTFYHLLNNIVSKPDYDMTYATDFLKAVLSLIYHTSLKLPDFNTKLNITPFGIFQKLAPLAKKLEIRDDIINLLFEYITLSNDYSSPDSEIYNCGPLYFLCRWAAGTSKFEQICQNISDMLQLSIPNRYQCFQSGVLLSVIDHIAQSDSSEYISGVFSMIGSSFFHKAELSQTLQAISNGSSSSTTLLRLLISILSGRSDVPQSFIHIYPQDYSYFKASGIKVVPPFSVEFMADHSISNCDVIKFSYQNVSGSVSVLNGAYTLEIRSDDECHAISKSFRRTSKFIWTKFRLDFTKTGLKFINEAGEPIELEKIPRRIGKNNELEIIIDKIDFEYIRVSQLGLNDKIIAEFNAKSVHVTSIYNLYDNSQTGYVNGLVIPYTPTIFSSIKAAGGPAIFLPILFSASKFPDPKQLIESFFSFINPLISLKGQLFKSRHFFYCLNQVIKQINKNFIPSNLIPGFSAIYNTIQEPIKSEFEEEFLKDLSVTKLIPLMIPDIYFKFPNLIESFKTFNEFLKNIIFSFRDDELDLNVANNLYSLLVMMKDNEFSFENDFPNILMLGLSNLNPLISNTCLSFVIRLMLLDSTFILKYLSTYGYFYPIFANIHSTTIENQCLMFKLLAMIFNYLNHPHVLNTFLILTASTVFIVSNVEFLFNFLILIMKTQNPENITLGNQFYDDVKPIAYPQFLPVLCHLLMKMDREDACRKLENLRQCFFVKIPHISNIVFYQAVLYIANFTKDLRWLCILFPDSKVGKEVYQVFSLINICISIFGPKFFGAYKIISQHIFDNRIYSQTILSALLYCTINISLYDVNQTIKADELDFLSFLRLIPNVINRNSSPVTPFAAPPALTESLKTGIILLIQSNIQNFGSDTFWSLFTDNLIYIEKFDPTFILQQITHLQDNDETFLWLKIASLYIYNAFKNDKLLSVYSMRLMKSQWQDLSLMTDDGIENFFKDRQISKITEAAVQECKDYLADAIKEIRKVFDQIDAQVTTLPMDIESFQTEMRRILGIINDTQVLDRKEKHRIYVWENLNYDLYNTIGGIWMTDSDTIHKKFDPAIDSYGRHYRLKPNKHFNDHMDASRMRDASTGEVVVVERMKASDVIAETHKVAGDAIITLDSQMCTVRRIYTGKVVVSREFIYFEAKEYQTPITDEYYISTKFIEIETQSITHMLWRRYQLINCACEIFTNCGDSYFFVFNSEQTRNQFLSTIADKTTTPNIIFYQKKPMLGNFPTDIIEKWKTGKMTNYEYLYWLNMFSGRSYNDISQYPVFPWTLSNYRGETLNLNDINNYRKLSKPLGTLNPVRLQKLIETRNEVKGTVFDCLYRVHYSSASYIIFYMIRMEPFTTLHILLQKDRFDNPNRLFTSIPLSWDGVTGQGTDYRELIPEFYSFSDFLKNYENYDLGVLTSGKKVHDVELPPWAKNAAQFVILNRMALESPYVSENINQWIDLIFGCRSRGKGAEDVFNVFSPYSYPECLDDPTIDTEVARSSAYNFGSCPDQLFVDSSPERLPFNTGAICTSSAHISCTESLMSSVEESPMSLVLEGETPMLIGNDGSITHFRTLKNGQITTNVEKYPFECPSAHHFVYMPDRDIFVVSAPYKDTYDIVSISKRLTLKTSPQHGSSITALDATEDGDIVVCTSDSSVFIWQDNKEDSSIISAHAVPIEFARVNKNVDAIVTIDTSGLMVVHSLKQAKPYAITKLPEVPNLLLISKMGLIVTVTSPVNLDNEGKIEVRDLCCNLVSSAPLKQNLSAAIIAVMPDQGEFLLIGLERRLVLWRLVDLKIVCIHSLNSRISRITFCSSTMTSYAILENGEFFKFSFQAAK